MDLPAGRSHGVENSGAEEVMARVVRLNGDFYFADRCTSDCSFSLQMNSIRFVSSMSC